MNGPQSPSGADVNPEPSTSDGPGNPWRPAPQALVFIGWYSRSEEPGDVHYAKPELLCRLDNGDATAGADPLQVRAECGETFRPMLLWHGDYLHPRFPDIVCRMCLKAANR